MSHLNTKTLSHRRLTKFVDWIKTPEEKEDDIRKQAKEIRERISAKATQNGLTVSSTPNSGSFAKRTGLRRHMQGDAEIEGQDVDLPFVVMPKDEDGANVDKLLDRFEVYAEAVYPKTARKRTKSSVKLQFVGTKLSYDLVPMLAVSGDDEQQILLRRDGERRLTSVQKHIDFVKTRTDRSNQVKGRVLFNECVRLFKWWREVRQAESQILDEVPTILIDLLCAKAFDQWGVQETYTGTLSQWFGWLANVAKRRQAVGFSDYTQNPLANAQSFTWAVIDPVNSENNVVPKGWGNMQIDELAEWLQKARDAWGRVIARDLQDDQSGSMGALVDVFGNPFKHHGEIE